MPRLVLYDDDARVLFSADVSSSNVEAVAAFLQRNMGALRAAAAFKRALESAQDFLLGAMGPNDPVRRPPPLKPSAPPRARGGRRR